ncbi:MAG: membrane protein insertase YidC [Clostridia bacterium]|nr:membrane protein insertase YidC [Clostridia bacterium]
MTFFLTRWFYALMQFLYGLFNNDYFLTILVVTILLRIVQIFPDISNRKTQIKMAVVQPKIQALQKKYADDPQKLRLEQSKLMKEQGVSTFSSCLPMLLTIPLFFCFLSAFRTWGNEDTITLMYETAITQTMDEGSAERAYAEETAMDTFKSFKFLWTQNIWQPDCFIDGSFLIFRFDGEVITRPATLSAINSVSLANMPLLQNGYTDSRGRTVSGEEIWQTLVDSGLAAGTYGDAGNAGGCSACSSCSTDRSGMMLLPAEVDPAIADKMLGEQTAVASIDPVTGQDTPQSTATGSDIYKALMQRYPDAISKDGRTPANGLLIMPLFAALFQFLSMFITNRRNKKNGQQDQQAKQMNSMMYFMPIFSFLICLSSTTAFAFYWTISGAFQLVSSIIINAVFDRKKKDDVEVSA